MGSPTLQILQDQILLVHWVCFRAGGFQTQNWAKAKLQLAALLGVPSHGASML
jgi:hypothetical protein